MNKNVKRTAFICHRNDLSHYKCLYCVYINSLHDEDIYRIHDTSTRLSHLKHNIKTHQMKTYKNQTREENKNRLTTRSSHHR